MYKSCLSVFSAALVALILNDNELTELPTLEMPQLATLRKFALLCSIYPMQLLIHPYQTFKHGRGGAECLPNQTL